MLFWIIAALLTLGACLSVLLPFLRQAPAFAPEGAHDLMIYKDQLNELEQDQSRGLIGRAEAEQARNEIARRILKADQAGEAEEGRTSRAGRWLALAAVLSVPIVSWGVYAETGSPDQPSQPLQTRLQQNPANSSVSELMARAEAHLQANPQDGKGWDVLAPIYLRAGRAPDAVNAYRNAIKILGSDAKRESGLGEALMTQGGGVITQEAQAAFQRALVETPGDGKARFFLAMGAAQGGRLDEAKAGWQAMLTDLPAQSPWREASTAALAQANSVAAAQPGPSASDVENAAGMAPEDRIAMIETMVASLDAKLKDNPRDSQGWERLIRSYMVLGRADAARDALSRGMSALGNTTREAAALQSFAAELGLPGGSE